MSGPQPPPDVLLHERLAHAQEDPHQADSTISQIILGGQDGLVNVLGVVLGVAAATAEPRTVLVAGIAAGFAESLSMGAVAWSAFSTTQALYESERERELRHIREFPNLEREEIRDLYRRKGFQGELLDKVVETITSNQEVWVAVMMAEEHRLERPSAQSSAGKQALIVGGSSFVASAIPLVPYIFLPVVPASFVSLAVSAAALFGLGGYAAKVTSRRFLRGGLQLTLIGTITALVAYGVGLLLGAPGAH